MKKFSLLLISLMFVFYLFSQKKDSSFFPIAVWLQQPSYAYPYKQAGINLYIGNTLNSSEWNQFKVDKMKVICDQNAFALSHLSDTLIFGWSQQDEPDNAQWNDVTKTYDPCIDPDTIIARYASIRAKDTTRPVFLNMGQGVSYTNWIGRGDCSNKTNMYPVYNNGYLKGCDIASFDIYPVNSNDAVTKNNLWYVPKGIDSLRKWTEYKKPVWCWIETTKIDANSSRKPTTAEVRSEVWMAIIHGATGIGYFCHSWSPSFDDAALLHDTAMIAAVKKINQQIASLATVINSTNTAGYATVKSSNAAVPIDIMTKNRGGADYLFAASMRSGTTTATFTIDSGNYVEVLGENRFIAAPEGVFTDNYTSYGVHLYNIITKKDLNTEQAVIKNISIFPNPFSDQVTFEIPAGVKGPFRLKLSNNAGVQVLTKQENSGNIIVIYRENLAQGIYFYDIINPSGTCRAKGKVMICD